MGELAIEVRFVNGSFEAADFDDLDRPEWPPHPSRLVSALVSVADDEPELLDAIRRLEGLAPPRIARSARHSDSTDRGNFVPTNELVKEKSYHEYPGRSGAGQRRWPRVFPAEPVVQFRWVGDTPNEDAVAALCRRLPYLGRSTCPIVACVVEPAEEPPPGTEWIAPTASRVSVDVSVPLPGYVDGLIAAHLAGRQPWEVTRGWVGYGPPANEPDHPPARQFDRFIVFSVSNRTRPPATAAVRYTTALRQALIKRLDGGPVALHGHGDVGTDWRQVACLALPDVGHPHADGHLLGFALAVPPGVPEAEVRSILRGLIDVTTLTVSVGRPVELHRRVQAGSTPAAQGLQEHTWTGPSRQWVSALPMVLDRHVKGPLTDQFVAVSVGDAAVRAGLPVPESITWSAHPLLTGAPDLRPNQRIRRPGEKAKPAVHVRITFAEEVVGPVVLGNLRHLGLGLMRPDA